MSLVTYTAVIAVRYPELDNVQNDLVCFGNYLLGEQATSGGFLPLFWDAPSAYMHAATDIGSAVDWLQSQVDLSSDENGCLAVLHNRNKMVATFGNSEWVTQSDGAVRFSPERYILCRHDRPLRSPGTNKGRISEQAYERTLGSAWQGAQPQKLTVSILLPGTSSAAEWPDLLQSRRQFWPTLTTLVQCGH